MVVKNRYAIIFESIDIKHFQLSQEIKTKSC